MAMVGDSELTIAGRMWRGSSTLLPLAALKIVGLSHSQPCMEMGMARERGDRSNGHLLRERLGFLATGFKSFTMW